MLNFKKIKGNYIHKTSVINWKHLIIGKNNYKRIRVKPGLWFGFKGMSKPKSLILNFSNYKFNKKEILRKKKEDINLKW